MSPVTSAVAANTTRVSQTTERLCSQWSMSGVIAKTAWVDSDSAPRAVHPPHWPSPAPRKLGLCPPAPRAWPPAAVRTRSARQPRRRARLTQTQKYPHRHRAVFERRARSSSPLLVFVYEVDATGFSTRRARPVRDLALDRHQGRIAGAEQAVVARNDRIPAVIESNPLDRGTHEPAQTQQVRPDDNPQDDPRHRLMVVVTIAHRRTFCAIHRSPRLVGASATTDLLACDTCTARPFSGRLSVRSCVRSLRVPCEKKRCILCEMARLQLRLLGGFDLQAGPGQAMPIKLKKAQALLAYLACHLGQSHPRDKLATLLWPEMDDRQARANLRKVLFVLRPGLSVVSPSLRLDEDTVTLDTAALEVDVLAFQRLARRADREALQQAVDLYRGDLLEGLGVTEAPFEEWLTAERERLRELALEALAKLLAHQAKTEEPLAVETARRLLALDPLQEAVHRTLIRLYARHGRRDAALRQYQSCVDTLRRELSVEPEAKTRQLYQEVLRSRATPSESARTALAGLAALDTKATRRPPPPLADEAPMIGREPELTRLQIALNEAFAGRGQLIAILGEAGIGKSRLVSQVCVEAQKRGALVLVGNAYPNEQALAYGPWIDALRTGGVLDRDDVLAHVAPAWRAELARLFPELAPHDDQRARSPEDAMRLFEAVAHLLERLAKAQPLVLVLEDVHWADEMTLRLTSVLSRRIAAWPILIVMTAREEDVADAPLLRDLLRLASVTRLLLPPLSPDHTRALVQALGRGRDAAAVAGLAERISSASGGNPFVVVETIRALEQGATPPTTVDALLLPERVRELIGARLERLSERARELAGLAAVIGREFEFALLQRASGLGADEAADGVEELVRSEEHTSELQSLRHLVCRLLLEK